MSGKQYSFRLDPELKARADALFSALGLNTTAAVTLFMQQALRENAIPFQIRLQPNGETRAAMQETEDILSGQIPAKSFTSVDALFEDLNHADD